MIFGAHSTLNTTSYIIFKIAIKSLMFAIFYFQIGEVSSRVLACQRTLRHVHFIICLACFRFLLWILMCYIIRILIIK